MPHGPTRPLTARPPSPLPPAGVRPKPPFATWPVQHYAEGLGFYWYLDGGVLVAQTTAPHGSLDVIDRHNDVVDGILTSRADELSAAGGLFMLFDWRSVHGYDQDARGRQRQRMRARPDGYSRRTVLVVDPDNKLLRMAISAANLFATMLLRANLEIVSSPDAVVAHEQLVPPRRGMPFYGEGEVDPDRYIR